MDPGEAYELDELVRVTGGEPVRLLRVLGELELAGLVRRVSGRFVRQDNR
jgi:predicted Rossmann fold nucleotide-binding protein DprA/Smf involved in DNA uptake